MCARLIRDPNRCTNDGRVHLLPQDTHPFRPTSVAHQALLGDLELVTDPSRQASALKINLTGRSGAIKLLTREVIESAVQPSKWRGD